MNLATRRLFAQVKDAWICAFTGQCLSLTDVQLNTGITLPYFATHVHLWQYNHSCFASRVASFTVTIMLNHSTTPPPLPQWRNSPQWARASSLSRLHDHTQRHTKLDRTPLGEWSARHTDLYLTTHNIHKRQISTLRRDSNPQYHQASDRRPTP